MMRQYRTPFIATHQSRRTEGSSASVAHGKNPNVTRTMFGQQRQTTMYSERLDLQCMDKVDEETLRVLIVELELNKPRDLPVLRVINVSQDLLVSVQGPER